LKTLKKQQKSEIASPQWSRQARISHEPATYTTSPSAASERAILVGLAANGIRRKEAEDTLDELALLADTAGAVVIDTVLQERDQPDKAHFIGRGKAEEIKDLAEEVKATVIIFDDDLSPAQTRNLEELIAIKIIDRSRLILDIFSSRAKTKEAQTQVELAQLIYMLPRLTRQWTHLSRQAGGGGASGGIGTRGPGETQLEVDRRATRSRINALEKALDKIARQRSQGRKRREDIFKTALVGYTNAGKSTLLQGLSGADVLIEDRLFATLDSTTRRVHLGYNRDILTTDTVGFIRKLPHHLVASFRGTLEEAVQADLLLHVVDASYEHREEHIATVDQVLGELGIVDRPTLMVFNKIDQVDAEEEVGLREAYPDGVFVSGLTGDGLDRLRSQIYHHLEGARVTLDLSLPQAEGKLISELHRIGEVITTKYEGNNVLLTVKLSTENAKRMLPDGKYLRT
jgi:GTPase